MKSRCLRFAIRGALASSWLINHFYAQTPLAAAMGWVLAQNQVVFLFKFIFEGNAKFCLEVSKNIDFLPPSKFYWWTSWGPLWTSWTPG